MTGRRRWWWFGFGVVVLLLVVLVLLAPTGAYWPTARRTLNRTVLAAVGMELVGGNAGVQFGLPTTRVTAREILLAPVEREEGLTVFLRSLEVQLRTTALLAGRLELPSVAVDGLQVHWVGEGSPGEGGELDFTVPVTVLSRMRLNRVNLRDIVVMAVEHAGAVPFWEGRIHSGRLTLSGGARAVALTAEGLDLSLAHPDSVRLAIPQALVTLYDGGLGIHELTIDSDPMQAEVDVIVDVDPESGRTSTELRFSATGFELRRLAPWWDSSLTRTESRLDAAGRLQIEDGRLEFGGSVCGWAGPVALDADSIAGAYEGDRLVLSHAEGTFAGFQVVADEAELLTDSQDYEVEGDLLHLDLSRWIPGFGPTDLSGIVSLRGSGFGGEGFHLDVDARELTGTLLDEPLAGGKVEGGYRDGRIGADRLELEWEGVKLDLAGGIVLRDNDVPGGAGPATRLEMEGTARLDPGAPLVARHLPSSDWSTGIRLDGRIGGTLSALRLTTTFRGNNLNWGPLVIGRYRGEADIDSLLDRPTGKVDLRGWESGLGDLPLDRLHANVVLRGSKIELREIRADRGGDRFTAQGSLALTEDGVSGELSAAKFQTPRGVAVVRPPVRFEVGSGGFRLDSTRVELAGGELGATVTWSDDGGLNGEYVVSGVDLHDLVQFFGPERSLQGKLDAAGFVEGDLEDPTVTGRADVSGLVFGPLRLGRARGSVRLEHGGLHIERLEALRGSHWVKLEGDYPLGPQFGWTPAPDFPLPLDLSLEAEGVNLGSIAQTVWSDSTVVRGVAGLQVNVGGSLSRPSADGSITVEGLEIAGDRRGRVEAAFHQDEGEMVVDLTVEREGRVEGSLPIALCVENGVGVATDGEVDLRVQVDSLDAAFVRHLIPDVGAASGRLRFTGRLGGTLPWVRPEGRMEIDGGQVDVGWMRYPLRRITGSAVVDGERIRLERLSGRFGTEGRWRAEGGITTFHYVPIDYDLRITGQRLPVDWIPDLERAVVDVDIRLTQNVLITGEVVVHKAVYTRDFGEEPESVPSPTLAGEGDPKVPVLRYSLDIRGNRNIWLRNRDAKMELRGSLHIDNRGSSVIPATGESVPFSMVGELEVVRGTYTLLGKNTFQIQSGVIRMLDPKFLDPEVEVTATARIRERVREGDRYVSRVIPVELKLGGNFFSDLTYEMRDLSGGGEGEPIPNEDVVLLLAFGRRRSAVVGGGIYESETALDDAASLTAQLLENRLSELLDMTFDIGTSGTVSPFSSLEETYVGLGKYVSDRLFVYYSQYLSADPRRKLSVEYNLSDRVLLAGELNETDVGDSEYNVDLRYRVEY